MLSSYLANGLMVIAVMIQVRGNLRICFPLFLVCSILFVLYGIHQHDVSFVMSNSVFIILNAMGVYKWTIKGGKIKSHFLLAEVADMAVTIDVSTVFGLAKNNTEECRTKVKDYVQRCLKDTGYIIGCLAEDNPPESFIQGAIAIRFSSENSPDKSLLILNGYQPVISFKWLKLK